MDIREKLKLAAIASGLTIVNWIYDDKGNPIAVLSDGEYWQPAMENELTDYMGDAFRLAVSLASVDDNFHTLSWRWTGRGVRVFAMGTEGGGDTLNKATAMAIVNKASELGSKRLENRRMNQAVSA